MWPLLSFAVGGIGAAGKLFEGFAKSDTYKMSAQMDRSNADLLALQSSGAGESAHLSLTKGAFDASQIARQVRSTQGAATTFFAGRNIDPTSGSPLLMEGYSAQQGAIDMALAAARGEAGYADGMTKAANISGQAAQQQWKAVQDEQSATTARISGIFGAATSLLSMGSTPWQSLGTAFSQAGTMLGNTFVAGNPWATAGA